MKMNIQSNALKKCYSNICFKKGSTIAGLHSKGYLSFTNIPLNSFPKCLYHFEFPPAMKAGSCCPQSL